MGNVFRVILVLALGIFWSCSQPLVREAMVVTADITVNGAHLGEYAEALVELRLPVSRYRR